MRVIYSVDCSFRRFLVAIRLELIMVAKLKELKVDHLGPVLPHFLA